MTRPRSRLQRIAPIWSLALRANRLLRNERAAHAGTRQQLVVAKAAAEHHRAHVADLEARCQMLEANFDFLVAGRLARMERGE